MLDVVNNAIADAHKFTAAEKETFEAMLKSGKSISRAVEEIKSQRVGKTTPVPQKPVKINSRANKAGGSGKTDAEKIWSYLLTQTESQCSRVIAAEAGVPEDIVFKRISEFKTAGLVVEQGHSVYKNRKGLDTKLNNYIVTTRADFSVVEVKLEEALEFLKLKKYAKPQIDTFKLLADVLIDRSVDHFYRAELINEFCEGLISFVEHNAHTTEGWKQKRINEKGLAKLLELQRKLKGID